MSLLRLFSLAASFLLPATGEVVEDFSVCSEFFLDGKPPNLVPENPARICQRFVNQYRFATMYDKDGRIPIFSAYKYEPGGSGRPKDWMIEPQLALPENDIRTSMESENTCGIDRNLLRESQAVSIDYNKAYPYNRGHLVPSCHQQNDNKNATFTLTNIVPQLQELNGGEWVAYERMMKIYTGGCRETYAIVGVVPGTESLKNRVVIPTHIWAAACCLHQNNQKYSWGALAQNNENKVELHNVEELQTQLANLYGKPVDLFNNACNAQADLQNIDVSMDESMDCIDED